MTALAIERYILIVLGQDAKTILNSKRRKLLYSLTVIFSFVVPSVHVIDSFRAEFVGKNTQYDSSNSDNYENSAFVDYYFLSGGRRNDQSVSR